MRGQQCISSEGAGKTTRVKPLSDCVPRHFGSDATDDHEGRGFVLSSEFEQGGREEAHSLSRMTVV